ncbi:enoyl-CoA hydratase/isomerase family protein [Sporosarcina trichiuri]|uniref:enoyl-CoA hydratase/isomerase family protein n=1 Tax=Sporosarcina trichiuri TaxID=3056445 RepID=UPI0025B51893|nr:enoyl-CoA hydratase/isomerase family protein [Sporosarcina sp. 0.2-SM1T-5]WJY28827.1 enoyl-CoA hydratase/isomerase family protein [Sporosarcina sp. 0.2-SM1T-5]
MSYSISRDGQLLTFSIERPGVRNAVSHDVMDGLEKFIRHLETDGSVEWGVVTSTGRKAFCSGGDLSEFHTLRTADEARPMLLRMTRLLYRLAAVPVPVIALMDGTAVGGGCELAAACDFRLMRADARAGFIQGTLAITTGWGGASLLYEKESLHAPALQLLMGAKLHEARTLEEAGWITSVYTDGKQEALVRFLDGFRTISPGVLHAYKMVAVRRFVQTGLEHRMLEEAEQCAVLWESDEHHEAVRRFREKTGRPKD